MDNVQFLNVRIKLLNVQILKSDIQTVANVKCIMRSRNNRKNFAERQNYC